MDINKLSIDIAADKPHGIVNKIIALKDMVRKLTAELNVYKKDYSALRASNDILMEKYDDLVIKYNLLSQEKYRIIEVLK